MFPHTFSRFFAAFLQSLPVLESFVFHYTSFTTHPETTDLVLSQAEINDAGNPCRFPQIVPQVGGGVPSGKRRSQANEQQRDEQRSDCKRLVVRIEKS